MAGVAPSADAHVHGMAQLDVAVEQGRVVLALHGAGDNFVGFEHAAQTPEQVAAVQAADARLAAFEGLLRIGTACKGESAEVTLPENLRNARAGELQEAAVDPAGHAHEDEDGHTHHEHGHDHDHASGTSGRHPSDWWIDATFVCTGDTTGLTLEARSLFEAFPRLQELRVQAVGASGQGGGMLKPDATTLVLP